jgi:hypothetical protein
MPRRPLELRANVVDDHLGDARTEDPELGAMHRAGGKGQETEGTADKTE